MKVSYLKLIQKRALSEEVCTQFSVSVWVRGMVMGRVVVHKISKQTTPGS